MHFTVESHCHSMVAFNNEYKGLIQIENKILEFIHRRFPTDSNWKLGNCFFFAVIMKSKYKCSVIHYDVIDGHFCVKIGDKYYDWEGIYCPTVPIEWDKFDEYDSLQKQVIIRDCIM